MTTALILCGGIGLTLGLIGGGGSILMVPVFIYVGGVEAHRAVALALAVVGATSALGALIQARRGYVHRWALLSFAGAGLPGALLGAKLTPLVPGPLLLSMFALLMIVVGARMLHPAQNAVPDDARCQPRLCLMTGFGLGALTGFLGVGGGFLIVPSLLRFAHLPIKQATGTSLAIIAANSLWGLLGHRAALHGQVPVIVAFTCVAALGMAAGLVLARRLKAAALQSAFGGLSLVVAAFLIVQNFRPLLGLWEGTHVH